MEIGNINKGPSHNNKSSAMEQKHKMSDEEREKKNCR